MGAFRKGKEGIVGKGEPRCLLQVLVGSHLFYPDTLEIVLIDLHRLWGL